MNKHPEETRDLQTTPDDELERPPSVTRQAWNLAQSLAAFAADGCKTVTKEQYRARLEICDTCEQRKDNRCMKCGCRLSLKARGRAFRCPLNKWPELQDEEGGC